MKRAAFLIISVIGLISLAACQESKENQSGSAGHDDMETTVLELELDSDYDDTEPFVNELLFCVSQDIDVLDAEVSIQMEGASGRVEIKENKTDEILWSHTWDKNVDNETSAVTLKNLSKRKEYVISFTGTGIAHAVARVTFQSDSVQEKVRPAT